MKKEAKKYLSIGALILVVLAVAYLLNVILTGFAVFEDGGLISPEDEANFSDNLVEFVVSVSHPNETIIKNVSLVINGIIKETNTSGAEGIYNFSVTLEDGNYNWSFLVFDTNNINYTSTTRTFTIETAEPALQITIHSPENTTYNNASQLVNISSNGENIWYNWNNTNQTYTGPVIVEFSEGENTLVAYANDTEGNITYASVSFSIDTSEPGTIPGCIDSDAINYDSDATEDDGSCTYEDSEEETTEDTTIEETTKPTPAETQEVLQVPMASMSSENVENITLSPGASQEISWSVKNTGEIFIFSCILSLSGENSKWISFEEDSRNINPNEETIFYFEVSVPEDAEEGSYSISVSAQCSGISTSKSFNINVEIKKLEFEVIEAQRTRADKARIIYSLSELIGEDQEVKIYFSLFDDENQEVSKISENKSISANSLKEFNVNMQINESLEGNMSLVVNYGSKIYSSSVRKPIVLGAPVGGFAIFEEIGTGEAIIFFVVLLFLTMVLIFVRRKRKSKKTLKDLVKK